ncbi:ABC transporter substrate-binding protein [Candidatus Sumerlaeota bacterium]|nr:ABC transporter substrate-binding protein [Candidatus Sumerlaeota bacterium]
MASSPLLTTPDIIHLGHSPDPDDAFMFYGLARDLIDAEGLRFEHILRDIETLNQWAAEGRLEVTALSLNAYTRVADKYAILNSGASMGQGYGPMVIAREPFAPAHLDGKTIAVPGINTTAFLTLRMCIGKFEYEVIPFDEIFQAVAGGKVDAGLIIHEGQLTFEKEGFYCILDLGQWWEKESGGLPLPLGINGVRKDLGPDLCRRIDRVLKRSIQYSLQHRAPAVEYALQWGRGLNINTADQFIGMYVNELTVDTGGIGRPAIEKYLTRAKDLGLIPNTVQAEFVGS